MVTLCVDTGEERGRLSFPGAGTNGKCPHSMSFVELASQPTRAIVGNEGDGSSTRSGVCRGGGPTHHLFTGHADGTIAEWNIGEGRLVRVFGIPYEGSGLVRSVAAKAFTNDGSRTGGSRVPPTVSLVSGYEDGRLRRWDTGVAFGEEGEGAVDAPDAARGCHLPREGGYVYCSTWAPNGRIVAFGRESGAINVWSFEKMALEKTLNGHGNLVYCVDFSADSVRLASVDGSNEMCVWNVQTGKCIRIGGYEGDDLRCVLLLGNSGGQIMTGDFCGRIRVWDIRRKSCVATFDGLHSARVAAVAVPREWSYRSQTRGGMRDKARRKLAMAGGTRKKALRLLLGRKSRRAAEIDAENAEYGALALSRDLSGRRVAWRLRSGDAVEQRQKRIDEDGFDIDGGRHLATEFARLVSDADARRWREARNDFPKITSDGVTFDGAERTEELRWALR